MATYMRWRHQAPIYMWEVYSAGQMSVGSVTLPNGMEQTGPCLVGTVPCILSLPYMHWLSRATSYTQAVACSPSSEVTLPNGTGPIGRRSVSMASTPPCVHWPSREMSSMPAATSPWRAGRIHPTRHALTWSYPLFPFIRPDRQRQSHGRHPTDDSSCNKRLI